MISKSFLKSSFIFTIGGALSMIGGLILLPFYANRLNDVHYAQVQFYISTSLLLQIFFSYTVESYFGIKYTQLFAEPEKQKKFIGTISIFLLLLGLGLLALFSASGDFLFSRIFRPDYQMEFWPYGIYSVLTAFFNSYFKVATNALIYLKKTGLFLTANILNFVFTLAISIGGLHLFPDSIIGPMYGRLISGIVIFVVALYIFRLYGDFRLDKSFLPDLNKFCAPYFLYALSCWVLAFIDRYFLQPYIPKSDLNTYDLVLKCFIGVEFVQNQLSAIIFPKIYEIWAKQEHPHTSKESNRYFNVFTAINITQLILFCIAIPFLYQLIIKNEAFYESEKYIGILAAGFAIRTVLNFYLSTILYTKSGGVLLKIFGISAILQIPVTWFAIRFMGLEGAIYAGLFIKTLQVIFSVVFTKGIFVYNFNYFKIIGLPFIYIAINILQFVFIKDYNIYFYLAQLVLFTAVFFLIFRKEIGAVYEQFSVRK